MKVRLPAELARTTGGVPLGGLLLTSHDDSRLVLFAITLVINVCSRLLIVSMTRSRRPAATVAAPVPEPTAA